MGKRIDWTERLADLSCWRYVMHRLQLGLFNGRFLLLDLNEEEKEGRQKGKLRGHRCSCFFVADLLHSDDDLMTL